MKITKDRQIEQEANYFAMCLLMPDFLVKIEIEKLKMKGFTESSIKELAKLFAVTELQMTIRLSQLGYLNLNN